MSTEWNEFVININDFMNMNRLHQPTWQIFEKTEKWEKKKNRLKITRACNKRTNSQATQTKSPPHVIRMTNEWTNDSLSGVLRVRVRAMGAHRPRSLHSNDKCNLSFIDFWRNESFGKFYFIEPVSFFAMITRTLKIKSIIKIKKQTKNSFFCWCFWVAVRRAAMSFLVAWCAMSCYCCYNCPTVAFFVPHKNLITSLSLASLNFPHCN